MRMSSGPMTSAEFEEALAEAKHGAVVTDLGATDEMDAALRAVAIARPSERRAAIREARRVFRESTNPGPIN